MNRVLRVSTSLTLCVWYAQTAVKVIGDHKTISSATATTKKQDEGHRKLGLNYDAPWERY